jgi:hypothetical protein
MYREICRDMQSPNWNKPVSRIWCSHCGISMVKEGIEEVRIAWNTRASLQPATPTSPCPYKGPFGCKCEPGECKYKATDAVAGEAKAIGWISEAGLHTLQNDNDATICCDNSPGGFNIPVFLRSTSEAATPAAPVMWVCLVGDPADRRIRAWTADHKRMESLRAEGLDMQPLYAGVAQSVTEPSDEWCNAFLKATGEWIEPHEPETECGVPMECEITQEFADELNADARKQIRKGYAAACSISSTEGK